jgi:cytoskeletal protein CcmA (bactofilin family)
MKMEKIIVKEDETIELSNVDGNLEVLDGATVDVSSKVDKLVVSGNLISKGDVFINGSLEVKEILHKDGYLEIEGDVVAKRVIVRNGGRGGSSKLIVGGSLDAEETTIDGGLEVEKNFDCPDVRIRGSCAVYGNAKLVNYDVSGSAKHEMNLEAKEVEIGGSLKVGGDAQILDELEVSGSAKIEGYLECPDVEIGGSFVCGDLLTDKTDVSGSAKTQTAEIKDKLSVSGSYKCEKSCISKRITISGSCKLGDESKIEKFEVSGSAALGDSSHLQEAKVSGSLGLGANVTGGNIAVSGSCSSSGYLKLDGRVSISGSLSGEEIEAKELSISGGLTCEIAKADLIEIGQNSRVRGKLVGGTVIIESGARVEDIIADEVTLEDRVRAKTVKAGKINADSSAKFEEI